MMKPNFPRYSASVFTVQLLFMRMDITSTAQTISHGVTSNYEVFLTDIHLMQGQTKGLDFIQALLGSL
jgi:hypothetical protein